MCRLPTFRDARRAARLLALILTISIAARAHAQAAPSEAPDPTRLDVERLPPEAIVVTRDMFARGLFVQAYLGTRAFFGPLGSVTSPGLLTRVGVGYELADWVALGAAFELSLHAFDSPLPPSEGQVQLMDAVAELRLQWPLSARFALFIAGEGGVGWTTSNLLVVHGFEDANSLRLLYGGNLGFDWHLFSRHHSLGMLAGARLYPGLQRAAPRAQTLGMHSTAYLRYVF
jgi:hypothetical protein